MSATTVLELTVIVVGVVAALVALAVLGGRPSRWDAAIGEHLAATGDHPTVGQWRSGRVGWDATRPPEPQPGPWGPVEVTVVAVDGKPVAGSAR